MRPFLALALLLAGGCSFGVRGVDAAAGADSDLSGLTGDDLAGGAPSDMGTTTGGDLPTAAADLLSPPLALSHVPQHYLDDGTCDLVVNSSIDTSARKVDGADVPAGCVFTNDTESGGLAVAVLAVHSLVASGTINVTGTQPLVIVAHTTIQINGTLDGSATKMTPGPGGAAPAMGAGAGPSGEHAGMYADSGGSGGSYGTVGGIGGIGTYGGATTPAQTAGTAYGSALLTTSAPGGSGGGYGKSEACNNQKGGNGGAGGGSIQLSAGTSISVGGGGLINVGGGAGGGGCEGATTDQGSGGGGGSGGAIFLEAPSVTVNGGLWANGGSGGGGASGAGTIGPGKDGNDATTTQTAAAGGMTGGDYGGTGGVGFAGTTAGGKGGEGGIIANGGGGGGGAGRIVIRSRGSATLMPSNISPAPALDATVP